MAIIPTTKTTIARYAAGLYGVKLGSQSLTAVVEDVQLSSANGINGLNTVLNNYYGPFAGMTSAQVAAIVVTNAGIIAGNYGLTATNVADSVAVVTAQLNAAAPTGTQGVAIANVLASWSNDYAADAVFGPAANAWNLKIAQANDYANVNAEDVAFGAVNTEFVLTTGNDRDTGTAGNDTFVAGLNTLNDADVIDGGAGRDTLKAMVNGIIAPTIKNVEHLQFQAQFRTFDSADNNLGDEDIVKVDFNTNVTSVTGFDTIENNNSRADLIIEDVRIGDNQKTKDITIVMRETDPGNVDYGVYFDQNSLRNVSTNASQINLRVLDTYNTSLGNAPLKDSPYGAFTFSYSLDGGAPVSLKLESDAIQNAQTFPEMVAALQIAADEAFEPGTVTVSLGSTYTVPDSVTGVQVQGSEIVLAAKGSIEFSTPVGSGWLATEVVPAISGLHTSFTVGGSTATELVTSNIILDDVGRGSTGGDLVVGGLSVGETSTSKGVQKFLIEVQDNSKLQTINSTNNTLQEVVIVNGITTRVNNAYNENEKGAGSLTVRGFEQPNDGFGNNALPGADTLGGAGINHGAFGFTDVRVIDASAMTGKLDIDAQITARSVDKYLNLKDGAPAVPAADNVMFAYTGGNNNDKIDVVVDSTLLASHTLTGREDFKLNVSGGAGNDTLTVDIGTTVFNAENGQWRIDQFALKNVNIDGGAGNDTINAVGTGYFNIEAGVGNDNVYVDNTGAKASWVVAAANTEVSNLQSAANALGRSFLYKGKATVTFAAGNESGLTAAMAVALDNGFEVSVDVPTGDHFAVTQFHVNQAIKKAINSDPVLNKLLSAEDGPGTSLVIKSVVDGSVVAGDLAIVLTGTDLATLPASEQASVLEAFKNFSGNSAATIGDANAAEAATVIAGNAVTGVGATVIGTDAGVALAGSGSSAHNDSVINAGAGDDVVVLSTGAFSNNVVKFTGYEQGNTTIVNFNNAGTGADLLDFSSYLMNKASPSGSVLSQTVIARTLNVDATVEANSITVLNLVDAAATPANNFANLSADKFLAAINSTNTGVLDYANINAGTLNALNTYTTSGAGTSLVGGVGTAVVLVHNEANDGQYKAFEVTFNGTATNTVSDFSAARLIGTFDLGESLTDAAAALLTNAQSAAEGPVVVPPPAAGVMAVAPGAGAVAATAGADAFTLDVAALLADAAGTNTQATITGFDVAQDSLVLDLPLANAAITTLAALNGEQGVTVLDNPFAGSASINFGNDLNGGEAVTLDLVGITPADWANVVVQVV